MRLWLFLKVKVANIIGMMDQLDNVIRVCELVGLFSSRRRALLLFRHAQLHADCRGESVRALSSAAEGTPWPPAPVHLRN